MSLIKLFVSLLLVLNFLVVEGQNVKRITDKHIVNQQERMVHKQWDRKKFTPTKGFLGLNYQYWLTWGLHPNYPKLDRRPLSPSGPQTLRMGLVLAMQNSDEAYKRQADTIRNTAISELTHNSGIFSEADLLYVLYYKKEFSELREPESRQLESLPNEIVDYLKQKGVWEWYREERAALIERLEALKSADMERGSRIMGYHRMLMEYRTLNASWEAKKNNAQKFLNISKRLSGIKDAGLSSTSIKSSRTDIQIADDILIKNR
ncbi:conserved exported hypothetical protein [Sphingobacterium sp. PM2-P1-29]|nr:conserved exported hypothetical protein [Sphingobacterium sp. PM2-P1-29]